MTDHTAPDWADGCAQTHLRAFRAAPARDLPALALSYDWAAHPEPVLGWVMAQKSIDLGTAVTLFFEGGPQRFNYMQKRDVPKAFHATARLLDNMCLRMNCGFYLARPGGTLVEGPHLDSWMATQKQDRVQGACGRWVLDEGIIASLNLISGPVRTPSPETTALRIDAAEPGWRKWLTRLAPPRPPEEILTRDQA